jgi:hypothetical protein
MSQPSRLAKAWPIHCSPNSVLSTTLSERIRRQVADRGALARHHHKCLAPWTWGRRRHGVDPDQRAQAAKRMYFPLDQRTHGASWAGDDHDQRAQAAKRMYFPSDQRTRGARWNGDDRDHWPLGARRMRVDHGHHGRGPKRTYFPPDRRMRGAKRGGHDRSRRFFSPIRADSTT